MQRAVVVTASSGTFPGLVEALRELPVAVEEYPLMTFVPPADWGPLDRALDDLSRFDAIALTSPRAARAFAARLAGRAGAAPNRSGPAVWAGGGATAAALSPSLPTVRMPAQHSAGELGAAAALAGEMLAAGVRGPVLFPCGELRRDELPVRLRHEGVEVEEVVCYRSVLAGEAEARAAAGRASVLVVASPSVVDLLARACPPGERPTLLAVGPTTAAASRAVGWPAAAVAASPTTGDLLAGVRSLLATPGPHGAA